MYVELLPALSKEKQNNWVDFLKKAGLEPDASFDCTALIWGESGALIATGSRFGNLLKCIAVEAGHQGEGLTATLVTTLKKEAADAGIRHLFLYTKPENKAVFESLFFYSVAETSDVLLMEDKKDGILSFLETLPFPKTVGKTGCIVMNCNPFTLGHLYLAEQAATECDTLYLFVVSEDKSLFSAQDRLEMVKLGTAHLPNIIVVPTGPYLISSATFPTYFLKEKERAEQIKCALDIEIFVKYYAKKLNITTRFLGTEPLSQTTAQYNAALKATLPDCGIAVCEIPRLEKNGAPISASRVRECIAGRNTQEAKELLPDTTYRYLLNKGLL